MWICGCDVSPALEAAERSPRCVVMLRHVTAVSRHSDLSVRAQARVQMWCERVHMYFKASNSLSRWSELTTLIQNPTPFSQMENFGHCTKWSVFQKSFKKTWPSWQNNQWAVVYSFKRKKNKKNHTQLRMEWPFAMSQDDHRLYWNDRVGE